MATKNARKKSQKPATAAKAPSTAPKANTPPPEEEIRNRGEMFGYYKGYYIAEGDIFNLGL
jgi:hypothetical protein